MKYALLFFCFWSSLFYADEKEVEIIFWDGSKLTCVLVNYGFRNYTVKVSGKTRVISEKEIHKIRFALLKADKVKKEIIQSTEKKKVICQYQENGIDCLKETNPFSLFCPQHYQLKEKKRRKEKYLKNAEVLLFQLADSITKANDNEMAKTSSTIEDFFPAAKEILTEIELSKIKQQYSLLKENYFAKNNFRALNFVEQQKVEMLTLFINGHYLKSLQIFKKTVAYLAPNKNHPKEIINIQNEMLKIKEKAKIHIEFEDLAIKIQGILWNRFHPEEALALINDDYRGLDDYISPQIRIVSIKRNKIMFMYKGNLLTKRIRKE